MNGTCDYATCTARATREDDGWEFCKQHHAEHRADLHGEPWPKMKPVKLVGLPDLRPCGTLAAARRHHRRGEPLCTACSREANAQRRFNAYPTVRNGRRFAS